MREFSVGDIVKTQIGKEALYGKVAAFHYNYKLSDYEIYIEPFGSESSSINNWHIQHFTVIGLENIEHFSAEDVSSDDVYPGYSRYNVQRANYRSKYLGEMLAKGFEEGLIKNVVKKGINSIYGIPANRLLPNIVDVIYHEPATIVKWSDGSKTVVKCGENDIYDPEKGLAMCIAKKALGNNGNYYELFKKWLPKEPEEGEKCRLGEVNSISMNDDGVTFNVALDPASKWCAGAIQHLNDILNPGNFMFKIVDPEEKSKDEDSST